MELKTIKYCELPNRKEIISFYDDIKDYLFPNYFNEVDNLEKLVKRSKEKFIDCISKDTAKMDLFYNSLPSIYNLLLKDIEWAFNSDPACLSYEEALIAYPGVYAIIAYRIAHELAMLGFKIEARIISEHAHTKTGIDIHPLATIGNYFFIDHGTGVVIGETTTIGDYVKIYQGVTLGAKTLDDPRAIVGVKRHPTIGSHVTIYANASILGGDVIIGDNTIIGGNTFITKSVEKNSKVTISKTIKTNN